MTLHVAYVTDRAYLPWCATAVRSLADHHAPDEVVAHVVHDGSLEPADEAGLLQVSDSIEVVVRRGDVAAVEHLPALDRFGRIVWLRFLLPELLAEIDRVLYLDADTFVAAPLTELAQLDLRGDPLAASINVMLPPDHERLRSLGLDPEAFFNSGVLLLDLDALRAEGLARGASQVVETLGERLHWPDQDVLNVMFDGRWQRLHPRFNAQNSLLEWPIAAARAHGEAARAEALADTAIVHFEGPYLCKPWHALSQHPWRDRYLATLARTPWGATPLDDDGRTTRAIRRLPRAWQLPIYEQVVRARAGARPSVRGALRRRRQGARLA